MALIHINAESGIDLTMLRCTFYRNFCPWITAGLLVTDAWPLVANMVENTFTHNDALVYVHDAFYWAAELGPPSLNPLVCCTPMIVGTTVSH